MLKPPNRFGEGGIAPAFWIWTVCLAIAIAKIFEMIITMAVLGLQARVLVAAAKVPESRGADSKVSMVKILLQIFLIDKPAADLHQIRNPQKFAKDLSPQRI